MLVYSIKQKYVVKEVWKELIQFTVSGTFSVEFNLIIFSTFEWSFLANYSTQFNRMWWRVRKLLFQGFNTSIVSDSEQAIDRKKWINSNVCQTTGKQKENTTHWIFRKIEWDAKNWISIKLFIHFLNRFVCVCVCLWWCFDICFRFSSAFRN